MNAPVDFDIGSAQEWEGCRSKTIAPGASTQITVTDLNPSSSYIFRLYAVADGEEEAGPGPEVAFDTEGGSTRARFGKKNIAEYRWNLIFGIRLVYGTVARFEKKPISSAEKLSNTILSLESHCRQTTCLFMYLGHCHGVVHRIKNYSTHFL